MCRWYVKEERANNIGNKNQLIASFRREFYGIQRTRGNALAAKCAALLFTDDSNFSEAISIEGHKLCRTSSYASTAAGTACCLDNGQGGMAHKFIRNKD